MAEDRPNFSDDVFRIVTHIKRALDLVENSALLARTLALRVELDVSFLEAAHGARDLFLDGREPSRSRAVFTCCIGERLLELRDSRCSGAFRRSVQRACFVELGL